MIKSDNPFRYFNSIREVIHLVVTMYVPASAPGRTVCYRPIAVELSSRAQWLKMADCGLPDLGNTAY